MNNPNSKQVLFQEMVLGTLVYAVVLGFFEDYTEILNTWSYSITFSTAFVLQVLTYLTFLLKKRIYNWQRKNPESKSKGLMIFSVWLVMFLSKFVFLYTLDFIFGETVEISGFVGLLLIIITMFIVKEAIRKIYKVLG